MVSAAEGRRGSGPEGGCPSVCRENKMAVCPSADKWLLGVDIKRNGIKKT